MLASGSDINSIPEDILFRVADIVRDAFTGIDGVYPVKHNIQRITIREMYPVGKAKAGSIHWAVTLQGRTAFVTNVAYVVVNFAGDSITPPLTFQDSLQRTRAINVQGVREWLTQGVDDSKYRITPMVPRR